jgi:hypothetical protein
MSTFEQLCTQLEQHIRVASSVEALREKLFPGTWPKPLPCPLCQSPQVQFCGDRNNPAKAIARCRECKCTAPLDRWQNRVS